jgi:hypothetical protein
MTKRWCGMRRAISRKVSARFDGRTVAAHST